jgi:hypothetical protein
MLQKGGLRFVELNGDAKPTFAWAMAISAAEREKSLADHATATLAPCK